MIRVLFVCHGNICRSPMAEFIFKDMLACRGMSDNFYVASAATSTEEIWNGIGNPVYPPARRKLLEQGIPCGQHAARQMTRADYDRFDLLIGMDRSNLRTMQRICGGDPDGKLHLLLDFTDRQGEEVADPWYTGDFDVVWEDLLEGCQALLREYR